MSKSVQNITLDDFLIQQPSNFNNDKLNRYSECGIPAWVYDLEITKLSFLAGSGKIYNNFKENLENNILQGKSLFLYSDSSKSGKSTVLFKTAMLGVDLGLKGCCFYFSDLLSLFKEIQVNSNVWLKTQFKHRVQESDFIVIDDFGGGHIVNKQYAKSEFSDMIYYCINGFYHKVSIFISSQIGLSNVQEYMTLSAYRDLENNLFQINLTGDVTR